MRRKISRYTKKLAEKTKKDSNKKFSDEYNEVFDMELQKAVNSGKTGKDAIKRAEYYTAKKEFEDNKKLISADKRTKSFKKYYERYKEKMIEMTEDSSRETKEKIEEKSEELLQNRIKDIMKEDISMEEKIHKLTRYTAKKDEYQKIRASEQLKYKFGVNVDYNDLEHIKGEEWKIKSTGRVIDLGVNSPDDNEDEDAILSSITIRWE